MSLTLRFGLGAAAPILVVMFLFISSSPNVSASTMMMALVIFSLPVPPILVSSIPFPIPGPPVLVVPIPLVPALRTVLWILAVVMVMMPFAPFSRRALSRSLAADVVRLYRSSYGRKGGEGRRRHAPVRHATVQLLTATKEGRLV